MIINFLKPTYWFTFEYAAVDGIGGKIIFATFFVLLVIGVFSRIVAAHRTEDKYMKRVGEKFSNLFITMSLLGIVVFFFSFQHISFFGARFWYLFWVIGVVAWLLAIVRFIKNEVPEKRRKDLEHVEKMKYMPRRKKKRRK
jgi:hypothetical protein